MSSMKSSPKILLYNKKIQKINSPNNPNSSAYKSSLWRKATWTATQVRLLIIKSLNSKLFQKYRKWDLTLKFVANPNKGSKLKNKETVTTNNPLSITHLRSSCKLNVQFVLMSFKMKTFVITRKFNCCPVNINIIRNVLMIGFLLTRVNSQWVVHSVKRIYD